MKIKRRSLWLMVGGVLLFILGGYVVEQLPVFSKAKKMMKVRSIPSNQLNYGTLGKLLKRQGLLVAIPDPKTQDLQLPPPGSETEESISQLPLFQKKRHKSKYLFQLNPGGEKVLPSSTIIKREFFKKGLPLLSVVVDEKSLYDKQEGIITNYEGTGGKWERLAYMSYFDGEQLAFATAAGLRLHGGFTRNPPKEWEKRNYSFRLYFRDQYGTNEFKPGLLFSSECDPVKHLVIHNVMPWQLRYTSVIAFDIARRIGCVVPETKAIQFFLNGKPQGYYYLSEHLNKRQWVSHMGHENFAFYRTRGDGDKQSIKDYKKLQAWAGDMKTPLTLEEANRVVDVDNLTRHVFLWAFCGTTDQLQGAAVLDRQNPNARWFWINWDMDQSFQDLGATSQREPWQRPGMELALGLNEPWMMGYVRPQIINRLLKDSPEYREFFVRLAMGLLNHRLTPSYFESLIDYYESLGIPQGGGVSEQKEKSRFRRDIEKLRTFLLPRSDFIRQELKQYFKKQEAIILQMMGAPVYSYTIDEYEEKGNYRGFYFPGQSVTITLNADDGEHFAYWLVNGKTIQKEKLDFVMEENTVISPISKNEMNLLQAVKNADAEKVQQILQTQWSNSENGAQKEYRERFMYLAMTKAVETGLIDFVQLLQKEGATIDVETSRGFSLTTHALAHGQYAVVDALIKAGGKLSLDSIKKDNQLIHQYISYLTHTAGSKEYALWNHEGKTVDTIFPSMSTFGEQGQYYMQYRQFKEDGKASTQPGISVTVKTADAKGKRRVIFGLSTKNKNLDINNLRGKRVHFIVNASIPMHLRNRHNYFLIRDFDGKWEESPKEFFSSSHWKTYILSKVIRPGSRQLSMYCSFTPNTAEDELHIQEIRVIVTKE